ncbi:DUF6503 family protein [Aquimarina sp. 2-A2]|uniref:DUF6503 family protein n=1 Tax=Aquimarina sp. 2-A2 TaxID=3382644 RepID=UPI00387F2FCB
MKSSLSSICIGVFLSLFTTVRSQDATQILSKAIAVAGGGNYEKAIVHFNFRGKKYRSQRNEGVFSLERIQYSNNKQIKDVVSNRGLQRFVNGCETKVVDSLITKISDGVNSVHYFAMLPYGLDNKAVNKKLVGTSQIDKNEYYKILVTFDQEGGGTDYEDKFMYWINKKTYTVDYLAYKYAVNGGGTRFRKAINPRVVNGLRFVDYMNYKTDNLKAPLDHLDKMFETNKLQEVSKILLKNISVYLPKT